MSELKFNSQICTTIEQSQRLLELGLKPETADMILIHNIFSNTYEPLPKSLPTDTKCYIPAWSLHRLLLLCDVTAMFTRDILETAYDDQINAIENIIKNGYFNKEYLKQ